MFCSKCGQENNDSASFCSKCGNPLQAASVSVEEVSLTPQSRIRSGAILALIGAILSILVILFVNKVFYDPVKHADFTGNFYILSDYLLVVTIVVAAVYGVTIWKAGHLVGKLLSVVGLVLTVLACFISFLCSLMGLANMEVLCIFNILNTVAIVILLVGSLKTVTGAFSLGKKK